MPAQSLVDRYRDQAIKLLPPGRALSRLVTGGLGRLLESVAVEYASAHERLDTLLLESFPGTATDAELLPEWEKATGLPNACTAHLVTESQRQQAVLDQLYTGLGQSAADFKSIATGLGYPDLAIATYEAFLTGIHTIGHMPLYSDPWLFAGRFSYEAGVVLATAFDFTPYQYDSDTVLGAQKQIRFNSTTITSINVARLGHTNATPTNVETELAAMADNTWIRMVLVGEPSKYLDLQISGASTDAAAYRGFPVDNVTAYGGFAFPSDGTEVEVFHMAIMASTDASLECNLAAHAHAYTQIHFNPWDTTPVAALSNLRHHFVHGEFVTHDVGGFNVIDSWINRSTGDDWIQGFLPDAGTCFTTDVDGWTAADAGLNLVQKSLTGLRVEAVAAADTFLKHGDFSLWMVVYIADDWDGSTQSILSATGGLTVSAFTQSGVRYIQFVYDGYSRILAAGTGIQVFHWAVDGITGYFGNGAGQKWSSASYDGGPYTDRDLLLGGGAHTALLEMVASDFEGPHGTTPAVDAVTDYLITKYGV